MTYQFAFKCSWLGHVSYAARDDGGPFEVTVRRSFSDYDRSICRPEWRDHEARQIDVLSLGAARDRQPTLELLRAFNAWLAADHADQLAFIQANAERFGELTAEDTGPRGLFAAPRPCLAIKAYTDRWVVVEESHG